MILRAAFLCLVIAVVIYGLLWLVAFTPFFKDKPRNRRILKRCAIVFASGFIAALAMSFLFLLDHVL